MKCLVSGATGFVGRQLCQRLAARGDTVIACSRTGAPLPDGTPTHGLDLAQNEFDGDLFEGVDVLFHLAGVAHQHAPEAAYRELNYLATIKLARRAAQAGVGCFVFLSSVKAMGRTTSSKPRTEAQCNAPTDAYGASKWQAESDLRMEFSDSGMQVVILRPALVYGERPKGNLELLSRWVRRGLPRPPDGGGRSMVAVDDLVDLLCLLADDPPRGVNTWIVSDGETYSTRRLYDLLRQALGRGRGRAWLPRWAWWLAARALDGLGRHPAGATYDRLFGFECYSNAAVVRATGWQPRTSLEEQVGKMITGRDDT
mgnify:CR=1 FL=1